MPVEKIVHVDREVPVEVEKIVYVERQSEVMGDDYNVASNKQSERIASASAAHPPTSVSAASAAPVVGIEQRTDSAVYSISSSTQVCWGRVPCKHVCVYACVPACVDLDG